MNIFQIKCAGFVIEIRCLHDEIKKKCEKYITYSEKSDIVVIPEKEHFMTAKRFLGNESSEEIEFAAILCSLHEKLIEKGACCIHAAVAAVDKEGYAFAAQSGVGKTTHIRLWKEKFKDRCDIINGDKPIITFDDSGAYASGSPWCGKEGYSENTAVHIKGICFLERAEEVSIRRLSDNEVIDRLFYQFSVPVSGTGLRIKGLAVANKLIKSTNFYLLRCNVSEEAVDAAYKEMSK